MFIDNSLANQLVRQAQTRKDAGSIQRLMEQIVEVENYRQHDIKNQGYIGRVFFQEQERLPASVDMTDIVAVFWEQVMKDLPRAAMEGEVVSVRKINEIQHDGIEYVASKTKDGEVYVDRKTKMNPVYWLRRQGYMAVRNFINDHYRDNWNQSCDDCGHVGPSAQSTEVVTPCHQCNSKDSVKVTLRKRTVQRGSNNSHRKCSACGTLRPRQFTRSCRKCGSSNVRVDYRFDGELKEDIFSLPDGLHNMRPDDILVKGEVNRELEQLLKDIEDSFPKNTKDNIGDTQVRRIFRILIYPEASMEMCGQCKFKAGMVCAEGCRRDYCNHDRKVNPSKSCGADSFQLDKCINYSKKIGEYMGFTGALANRRVQKIRLYVEQFLRNNLDRYGISQQLLRKLETAKRRKKGLA